MKTSRHETLVLVKAKEKLPWKSVATCILGHYLKSEFPSEY